MEDDSRQWFAMRDLTRSNAKLPAYRMLEQLQVECFTPMVWKKKQSGGRQVRELVPAIHDLLFVYSTREALDPIVDKVRTFQYRYLRNGYRRPMTVRKEEMNNFIAAVESGGEVRWLRPDEITPDMYGRRIRIVGGNLDGCEGRLLTVRGSRKKRMLVELPMLLAAMIEIESDYIVLL